MKKYVLVSIIAIMILSLAVSSRSLTGLFSKAFEKTLSPGEQYEKNITIRKYYNLTVRFQKENSTSYLSFDNNETIVVLKDTNGNEIARASGAVNGRLYFFLEKLQLDRIRTVSVYNLGSYQDVEDQQVSITYSGTKAYITVKVSYKLAIITGYVFDELTNQSLEGIEIFSFEDGADPSIANPIAQSITDSAGRYTLVFNLTSSKALDVYVKDYEVS